MNHANPPGSPAPKNMEPKGTLAAVWPAAVFTMAYMTAAVALALGRGNLEFLFYIVVMGVLISLVWLVHRRVGLSPGAFWGLSLWGFAHMAGGLIAVPADWPVNGDTRVLYSLWLLPERLKYDHVIHAYGFGVTTWVCWQALRATISRAVEDVRPTFGRMVLCAAAALGFGALNEVVEFFATLLVPETNVGGYRNTGWDLVSNTVGAVLAVTLIRLSYRHGTNTREEGEPKP